MNSEGKETLQNTDDRQRGIKGGRAFIRVFLHESHWWNVNTRQRGGQLSGNVAFPVPKCNYFGVFVQIRLVSRGPEPAAVCLGMSRANTNRPGSLQFTPHRRAHLSCWKNNAPGRQSIVSGSKKKYIFMAHFVLSIQFKMIERTHNTCLVVTVILTGELEICLLSKPRP